MGCASEVKAEEIAHVNLVGHSPQSSATMMKRLSEEGGAEARLALHSLIRNNLTLLSMRRSLMPLRCPMSEMALANSWLECSHRCSETLYSFCWIATYKSGASRVPFGPRGSVEFVQHPFL